MLKENYDVVIAGGGAAGLAAAVALARSRRAVAVIDSGDPRNAPAGHVHNFLTREGTPPGELLAAGRAEVTGYGGEIVAGEVTSVLPLEDSDGVAGGFAVTLADGRATRARRLLVATGLADELPDVEGLAQRWGRDVLHCPYCHGWEVRDQAIGVLVSSPLAMHQALLFRQLSDDVLLFQHTGPEPGPDEREQLDALGIGVVTGEVGAVEVTGDRLTGVRLRSGEVIARQALVVQSRMVARADLLAGLGLKPDDLEVDGHVIGTQAPADPSGATAVPGVWVAGNVADMRSQVISAAAAGLSTGAIINADLAHEDAARAVIARRDGSPR